jgi:hypothetical protein
VVLSSAQLEAALLAVDDLPTDWSEADSTADTGDLTLGMGGEEGTAICPDGEAALKAETHDRAKVDFQSAGGFLNQQLGTAPDAEGHFADLKAALSSCVDQTWTTTGVTASLAEVSGPKVGDESVSYELRMTMTNAGGSMSIVSPMTLARRATVIQTYQYAASPLVAVGALSSEELAGIIETGDQKVAAALAGEPTTTSIVAPPMTKADFVARANSICSATRDDIEELFTADPIGESEDLRSYLMRFGPPVTEMLREMRAELRQLSPPAGDEAAIERGWEELEALIRRLDVDPTWMFNQTFPKDTALYTYGLTECFVDHVDVL